MRVCYRNWSFGFLVENKGGILGKRASNSAGEAPGAKVKRAANTAQREDLPIEDDPTVAGGALQRSPRGGPEGAEKASQGGGVWGGGGSRKSLGCRCVRHAAQTRH